MAAKLPKDFPRLNIGGMLTLQLTPASKKNWRALKELEERAEAVERMVPFVAAHQTFLGVVSRIPSGPRWGRYQRRIRFARVGAAQKRESAADYAVFAESQPISDREIDSATSVLYVRPKKTFMGKVRKEVLVLAKYSPWTSEMLPFSPQKNEAVIVVRKVSKHEVKAVTRQREADEPEWKKALEEAGVRNVHRNEKLPELKTKVIQDLAFDALRLEFGYGGAKAVPHWRPGVREALHLVRRMFRQRSIFTKAFGDPKFRAWRKWPPRVESSINPGKLRSLSKFAKRLKLRV
jgi:hypothetical protein